MPKINGNEVSDADLMKLYRLKTIAQNFSEIFNELSPGCKQFLYELHNDETQLAHIARWGENNTSDAIEVVHNEMAALACVANNKQRMKMG